MQGRTLATRGPVDDGTRKYVAKQSASQESEKSNREAEDDWESGDIVAISPHQGDRSIYRLFGVDVKIMFPRSSALSDDRPISRPPNRSLPATLPG